MSKIERYTERLIGSSFGLDRSRYKSKKHIDFVHKLECVITGQSDPDAHHVQLRSQGLNDYTAIPLNHIVHQLRHDNGRATFEQKYLVEEKDLLIATLITRIMELEGKVQC